MQEVAVETVRLKAVEAAQAEGAAGSMAAGREEEKPAEPMVEEA